MLNIDLLLKYCQEPPEGATDEQLLEVEKSIGQPLPPDLRAFYKLLGGKDAYLENNVLIADDEATGSFELLSDIVGCELAIDYFEERRDCFVDANGHRIEPPLLIMPIFFTCIAVVYSLNETTYGQIFYNDDDDDEPRYAASSLAEFLEKIHVFDPYRTQTPLVEVLSFRGSQAAVAYLEAHLHDKGYHYDRNALRTVLNQDSRRLDEEDRIWFLDQLMEYPFDMTDRSREGLTIPEFAKKYASPHVYEHFMKLLEKKS